MLRTTLLLGALTGLIMLIGQWLGGSQGLVIAFIFAVLMNFGSYWFSDRIVLAAYGAQLVSAESQHVPLNASPQTAHLFIVNPLSGRSLMRLFSTHRSQTGSRACVR